MHKIRLAHHLNDKKPLFPNGDYIFLKVNVLPAELCDQQSTFLLQATNSGRTHNTERAISRNIERFHALKVEWRDKWVCEYSSHILNKCYEAQCHLLVSLWFQHNLQVASWVSLVIFANLKHLSNHIQWYAKAFSPSPPICCWNVRKTLDSLPLPFFVSDSGIHYHFSANWVYAH